MFTSLESADGRTRAAAWWPWALLYALVVVYILGGSERSVTPLYFEAAEHWLKGEDLYISGGRGFLYLPQAAILALPFHLMPRFPAEFLWRLMTIGVYALGVHRLCRLACPRRGSNLFVLASCVAAPLAWSSALNGQSTLTIAGLMMLAAHDITQRRYWRAAALLAFGVAVKPLAIVMLLLLAAIWRPMGFRLLTACLVAFAVPWLAQSPAYVSAQYSGCLAMLGDAAALGMRKPWAQFFGMLQVLDIEVAEWAQTTVRLGAALLTLAAGWHVRRRIEPGRSMAYLYAIATCYLMLFNPRTENNSYAMLAPAVGWCCAESFLIERRMGRGLFFVAIAIGTVGSHEIGSLLLPGQRAVWLAPLMALCFGVTLAVRVLQEPSVGNVPVQRRGLR